MPERSSPVVRRARTGMMVAAVVGAIGLPWAANVAAAPTQETYVKASNTAVNDQFGGAVSVSGDTMVVGAENESSCATGVNGDQANNTCATAGAAYVRVRSGGVWVHDAYLKASNTASGDRFGGSVAISGDTIVVGAMLEDSCATGVDGDAANNSCSASGAAYVFTRSGTTWTQQAYLKASNTDAADRFGWTVAISGETIVVGSRNEGSCASGANGDQTDNTCPSAGAAYVFTRSGSTWTQQAYLKASNPEIADYFGTATYAVAIAISADTLVVGAEGEDSCDDGVNGDQTNNGCSGAGLNEGAGAAYVFTRSGTTWTQQAYLKASNSEVGDRFGTSVAVNGDTVVVGAPGEDSCATGLNGNQADNTCAAANYHTTGAAPYMGAGAAYVFTRSGTTWTQQAYVKASNTDGNGSIEADQFGHGVTIVGDTMTISAVGESSCSTGVGAVQTQSSNCDYESGAVYGFARSGSTWTQQGYLKASNNGPYPIATPTAYHTPGFGRSLALSGATVLVGAPYERGCGEAADNPPDQYDLACGSAGAAYAFATGVAPLASTVTFDANQGAGAMAAQTGADDTALTANSFTRSGFNFSQWNTTSSGTGTRYDDGSTYPFSASTSATLYAQWSPWNTVTLSANDGTGRSVTQSAAVNSPLTTSPFTRSGFTFTGWATTAAGPGVDYTDGSVFPFSSSTTLYAQWQEAPATGTPPPGLGSLITQPVATTAPPSTTVAPSTTAPAPTTTMAPAPAPVTTPDGERPDMAPGDGLLLEDGVEAPVDVTVEQDTDVVLRTLTDDFELRLAGDCDTGCTVVDDETGRETIYLVEDGGTRVSGYGFKPGTYVDVWMFSDARYLGSLLVADDGTYSGDFALEGVPVGEHTVQANGISSDDVSRSANLGVVVQTGDVTPTGDLPATGSQPWTSMLGAVLATALGLVALARVKRVTPTRPR